MDVKSWSVPDVAVIRRVRSIARSFFAHRPFPWDVWSRAAARNIWRSMETCGNVWRSVVKCGDVGEVWRYGEAR